MKNYAHRDEAWKRKMKDKERDLKKDVCTDALVIKRTTNCRLQCMISNSVLAFAVLVACSSLFRAT